MMSCKLDLSSIDFIAEYLEIDDMELLVDGLLVLQDYENGKQ